jgi:hypothetical protein
MAGVGATATSVGGPRNGSSCSDFVVLVSVLGAGVVTETEFERATWVG